MKKTFTRVNSVAVFLFAVSIYMTAAAEQVGQKAPELELNNLQNQMVKLSSHRGKVVYLDFWASWCGPCRKSFPWMNAMKKQYEKDGLEIISVNLDKKREDLDKFLKKIPADFIVLPDPAGDSAKRFELKGMPSAIIIDRTGNIVSAHIGFKDGDETLREAKIKAALAAK